MIDVQTTGTGVNIIQTVYSENGDYEGSQFMHISNQLDGIILADKVRNAVLDKWPEEKNATDTDFKEL